MNSHHEDGTPNDNMEKLKQQAEQASSCCGSECACHTAGSQSKIRWIIGSVVLLAALAMVARAVVKSNGTPDQKTTQAFATPFTVSGSGTNSSAADQATETNLGTTISAFSELNNLAAHTDAVFIFLPGNETASNSLPSTPLRSALRTIEGKGYKCSLFTLKAGSLEHNEIASQMSVPAVLAIVKGRGMSPVSGDITEAKLIQAFVAASRSGGCGGGSCAPGTPGCK